MALLRSVATVGSYTLLSRVFGFVRDVLTAAILGAGPVADAFFVESACKTRLCAEPSKTRSKRSPTNRRCASFCVKVAV